MGKDTIDQGGSDSREAFENLVDTYLELVRNGEAGPSSPIHQKIDKAIGDVRGNVGKIMR